MFCRDLENISREAQTIQRVLEFKESSRWPKDDERREGPMLMLFLQSMQIVRPWPQLE